MHKLKCISGQGMSEYLILVMLIAVASIAAARAVGGTVTAKLNQIHRSLSEVTITSTHDSANNETSTTANEDGGLHFPRLLSGNGH